MAQQEQNPWAQLDQGRSTLQALQQAVQTQRAAGNQIGAMGSRGLAQGSAQAANAASQARAERARAAEQQQKQQLALAVQQEERERARLGQETYMEYMATAHGAADQAQAQREMALQMLGVGGAMGGDMASNVPAHLLGDRDEDQRNVVGQLMQQARQDPRLMHSDPKLATQLFKDLQQLPYDQQKQDLEIQAKKLELEQKQRQFDLDNREQLEEEALAEIQNAQSEEQYRVAEELLQVHQDKLSYDTYQKVQEDIQSAQERELSLKSDKAFLGRMGQVIPAVGNNPRFRSMALKMPVEDRREVATAFESLKPETVAQAALGDYLGALKAQGFENVTTINAPKGVNKERWRNTEMNRLAEAAVNVGKVMTIAGQRVVFHGDAFGTEDPSAIKQRAFELLMDQSFAERYNRKLGGASEDPLAMVQLAVADEKRAQELAKTLRDNLGSVTVELEGAGAVRLDKLLLNRRDYLNIWKTEMTATEGAGYWGTLTPQRRERYMRMLVESMRDHDPVSQGAITQLTETGLARGATQEDIASVVGQVFPLIGSTYNRARAHPDYAGIPQKEFDTKVWPRLFKDVVLRNLSLWDTVDERTRLQAQRDGAPSSQRGLVEAAQDYQGSVGERLKDLYEPLQGGTNSNPLHRLLFDQALAAAQGEFPVDKSPKPQGPDAPQDYLGSQPVAGQGLAAQFSGKQAPPSAGAVQASRELLEQLAPGADPGMWGMNDALQQILQGMK